MTAATHSPLFRFSTTYLLLPLVFCLACHPPSGDQAETSEEQYSAVELAVRQRADSLVQAHFAERLNTDPLTELIGQRDSVFRVNCAWLQGIYGQEGLPDVRVVGQRGIRDFWLLVQHCDGSPEFQERVLAAMENDTTFGIGTFGREIAYLTDRVRKHAGRPQLFGTQVQHGKDLQLVLPPLEDTCGVDALRQRYGLEPLTAYYDQYLQWHFTQNRAVYAEKGIHEAPRFTLPVDCPQ